MVYFLTLETHFVLKVQLMHTKTTLTVTDPMDRTITLPNASGTVALTSDITSSDVVDDTSPQLGGDLDVNGNQSYLHQMVISQSHQTVLVK